MALCEMEQRARERCKRLAPTEHALTVVAVRLCVDLARRP